MKSYDEGWTLLDKDSFVTVTKSFARYRLIVLTVFEVPTYFIWDSYGLP